MKLEITSDFQMLVALGSESECCSKLSTHRTFCSVSVWSTLCLFLSNNQWTKLKIIIAMMWQEGVVRRWEGRVPADFS